MDTCKIRGVLFDMDGVLLDTERLGSEMFPEVCAHFGYTATPELYNRLLGCNAQLGRLITHEEFGEDFPFDEVFGAFHNRFSEVASAGGLPVKKGLCECMEGLKVRGVKIALATSTERGLVERYIAHTPPMQDCFDAMVCGAEAGHSKPEPDIYLEAARRLGLSVQECIGVEDSRNGLRSLTAAGVISVMIPDLLPYDESWGIVTHRLKDLTQLCGLIDRLNTGAQVR